MSTHFLNNDRPLKPAPIYTAKKLTADQLKQRLLQLPNVKSFLQPSFTDEDLLQQAGYELGHTYHEKHILTPLNTQNIAPPAFPYVDFTNENVVLTDDSDVMHPINGIFILDGAALFGVIGGGDWEYPVYQIYFIDENDQFQGYIPERGNTVDTAYRCAFGSEINWTEDWDDYDEVLADFASKYSVDEDNPFDKDAILDDIAHAIRFV